MTVLVLTAVPVGLRGHITRWLLEIAPGVFVGTVTARVRDLMWQRVNEHLGEGGRAVMVYPARNEQGLAFKVVGGTWEPVDFEGLTLIRKPSR
ncbi:CRISPR-associated protein Cas2 [Acidimicrobium ferrooxidans DSM 10331]|uniref:CRISPR-associated protein Cas2 n=1 Tax=Acidimicrobium ferrooxidans (strain DSM 10331 / JCM 15462 / NBRC 103882 / ICP) TaxID=525909 RepID=C7LYW3_ACIFD|nr:CRISPR-associated protein Cas2 [Acidimicrobium ferrooxidans DSM 10331]